VDKIELTIEGRFNKSPQAIVVYITFAVTILLWLTGPFHGLKSYVVAMLPIAVFCASSVITAKDIRTLSWDVLWLIAGGFALGGAMKATGLDTHLVAAIPFDQFPTMAILAISGGITLVMATFMSHTATANLIMPIMAGLGVALAEGLAGFGGAVALILTVTFAASLGMALPISTPPNAMAHATGMVSSQQMAKAGTIICIIGLLMTFGMVFIMNMIGYLPK
ncbi:MAG: SLC13 family permease, partial [Planctomycetota bacterium]